VTDKGVEYECWPGRGLFQRISPVATFVNDCEKISPLMAFLASAAGVPW
jgi:hypothetical protein